MSDESPTDAPAAAPRRLPTKLWVVGGAGALLSALLGGIVAWLLMASPARPSRTPVPGVGAAASAPTKAASAAAVSVAAASAVEAPTAARVATAASAAATASAVAAGATSGPADGEPDAAAVGAAGAESNATGAASTASVVPRRPTVVAGPDLRPNAGQAPLPLERLRRRLDEVLAGRGRVAAGEGGELRVVSANATRPAPAPPRAGKATGHDEPAPGTAQAAPPHWHYGEGPGGPRQWGRLKAEFAACANGRRQSPIDIRDGLALDLEPLAFDYRPGAFSVLDNGHTVQVDVAPGNVLVAGGRRYALQQFHFHRPSEERIDGRRYDMDVHLVHRADDGRLAVVAVLLERGEPLPVLQTVWNHLPLERGEASTPTALLDPAELLPADRRYATYMGSLTTPPCTEGVLWIVLRQPVGLAQRQVDIFARLYPMNARPLQASAGRLIKQSN